MKMLKKWNMLFIDTKRSYRVTALNGTPMRRNFLEVS